MDARRADGAEGQDVAAAEARTHVETCPCGEITNSTTSCPKISGAAPLDLRNLMLEPWAGACNARMKYDLDRQLLTCQSVSRVR